MTDNHFARAVNSIARNHARAIERAGDFVGPNDMALANRLWALSAEMKEYGKRMGSQDRGIVPTRENVRPEKRAKDDRAI